MPTFPVSLSFREMLVCRGSAVTSRGLSFVTNGSASIRSLCMTSLCLPQLMASRGLTWSRQLWSPKASSHSWMVRAHRPVRRPCRWHCASPGGFSIQLWEKTVLWELSKRSKGFIALSTPSDSLYYYYLLLNFSCMKCFWNIFTVISDNCIQQKKKKELEKLMLL